MLFWTIQTTIISIIFIFLIHYLIDFFKTNLTVPKIKDLVNAPSKNYEDMYNIISHTTRASNNYTEIDLLPKPNVEQMKTELKSFLKEQLHKPAQISMFESSNTDSYASFN